jgi:hypothetical protein
MQPDLSPRSRLGIARQFYVLRKINQRYEGVIQFSRAVPLIMCGIWMMVPSNEFDPFAPNGTFHDFVIVAPRYFWGAVCYLIAGGHLWGVITGVWLIRRIATLLSLFWWLFLGSFLIYEGNGWRLVTALILANAITAIMFLFSIGRHMEEEKALAAERVHLGLGTAKERAKERREAS